MIINLNGELHLEETLSSINKQSHHDIEVVLVDGGSSDSSVSVFEGYNFHEGISKLLIENNNEANITESFKMGGQQSTGKYIYQLCSDDLLFDTDWLKVACHTLDKHRDIGAVWGRTLIMRDAKEIIRIFPPLSFTSIPQKEEFLLFWIKYNISPPDSTVVIRRDIYCALFPSGDSHLPCDIYTPHHMFDFYFILEGQNYYFIERIVQITRHIESRRSIKFYPRESECGRMLSRMKRNFVLKIVFRNYFRRRNNISASFIYKLKIVFSYIHSVIVPMWIYEYSLPILLKKASKKLF